MAKWSVGLHRMLSMYVAMPTARRSPLVVQHDGRQYRPDSLAAGSSGKDLLDLHAIGEVVLIEEAFTDAEAKVGQAHPPGIVTEALASYGFAGRTPVNHPSPPLSRLSTPRLSSLKSPIIQA
jgi:hypothetical protein